MPAANRPSLVAEPRALKWAWPMAFCSTGHVRPSPVPASDETPAPLPAGHIGAGLDFQRSACRLRHGGMLPNVQPPDATIDNPPADLFTKARWANDQYASGSAVARSPPSPVSWLAAYGLATMKAHGRPGPASAESPPPSQGRAQL